MNVNVDEVSQIIYRDSQSNHNISEVWQGGATPTLLWPKDIRYYTILNVTAHHIDGNGTSTTSINAAGEGFAYFIGDVAVYRDSAKQVAIDILYNQILTPVNVFPETQTYQKADGSYAPILYISQATHTIDGQSVNISVVKGSNLENYPLATETIYSVEVGYRTAPLMQSSVSRNVNTPSKLEIEAVREIQLQPSLEHDFIPPTGQQFYIEIIRKYDIWEKTSWTSGYSDPEFVISQDPSKVNKESIIQPNVFTIEEVNFGVDVPTWQWNSQAQWEDITLPANSNANLLPNLYVISASYQGLNNEGNNTTFTASLEYEQRGANFVFESVEITRFYYTRFDIDGHPVDDQDLIPASGGSKLPNWNFEQKYYVNGSPETKWTLTYISDLDLEDGNTIILADDRISSRTYTINFYGATDTATGSFSASSKGTTRDTDVDDLERGCSQVGTVILNIVDEDNNSDSEPTGVYQELNIRTIYATDDWYTSDYTLSFNISGDEIDSQGESISVYSNRKETRTEYYEYTSGDRDLYSEYRYHNDIPCTTFDVTGDNNYNINDNTVTFDANDDWEDREYTISDNSYYPPFYPYKNFTQPYIPIDYGTPTIEEFTYGDTIYPIICNQTIKPDFSFKQPRYRTIGETTITMAPIIGSDINGGYASDDSSYYTVTCSADDPEITVITRPIENGNQGDIVTVATVTITVTCNGETSSSASASVQQYKNYKTRTVSNPGKYDISITHNYNDNIPPRDPTTSNNGPYVSINGILYYYNTDYYASGAEVTDDIPDNSVPAIPTSIECSTPTLNPQYNSNTGILSFNENKSLDEIEYNITGICNNISSTPAISITISHGYRTIDNSGTTINFSYPTDKDDTYDNHYHIPASGTGDDPIIPNVSYRVPWRWNGRTTGNYDGYVTEGLTLSFSGTVVASGATLDTETGAITAESLGTTTTTALTLIADDVRVSVNGVYSSAIDIVQQINRVEETTGTLEVTIGNDIILNGEEKEINAIGGSVSFDAICNVVSTYTSGDDDSENPTIEPINSYASIGQNNWCSFNSNHSSINVNENFNTSSRNTSVNITNYRGLSYSCTLTQLQAEYVFTTGNDSLRISYRSTIVILNVTSLVNGHTFNNSINSLSFVSPYNNGIGLDDNPVIGEDGKEDFSITYSCSKNTGNARYSTVQATQANSGNTVVWTIEQQEYPRPQIVIESTNPDYTIDGFTVISNYPWILDFSGNTYDLVNGDTAGTPLASQYILASPNSGSAGSIYVSINNGLPTSYAAKITAIATDSEMSQSDRAEIVIMPNMYLYNYNNTYNWEKSADAQSWTAIETNYPIITWRGYNNDWVYPVNNDLTSLHVTANTGSERVQTGIIATGSTNWQFEPWHVDYRPETDSSDITVTQQGAQSVTTLYVIGRKSMPNQLYLSIRNDSYESIYLEQSPAYITITGIDVEGNDYMEYYGSATIDSGEQIGQITWLNINGEEVDGPSQINTIITSGNAYWNGSTPSGYEVDNQIYWLDEQ